MKYKSGLCLAVLLNDFTVDKYTRDLIGWIQQRDVTVLCVVARTDLTDAGSTKRGLHHVREWLASLISRGLFDAIAWIESWILRAYPIYRDHYQKHDVRSIARCVDEDQAFCDDYIDILIDCTGENSWFDRSAGRRFGVLSLRYGDPGIGRPGPPGFWESYCRHEATAFAVEGRKRRSEREVVVRTGRVTTQFFFSLNQAHLYAKSYAHLKDVLSALLEGSQFDLTPGARRIAPRSVRAIPPLRCSILYLLKVSYRLILKAIQHCCSIRQSWNISILPVHWERAAYWKSAGMPCKRGNYRADPFLCKIGETVVCFFEDYVVREERGCIACCTITHEDRECQTVLSEPFHLSFPFIFEYDGQLFMCPECEQKNEIRIYRCAEFPHKWVLERTIMKNISAADTMLFRKDERWWLLTNIDNAKIGDYCSDLYLFYANSPLAEEWTPHPKNPIKIDCRGGRNAGLLIEENRICRVGQRQGFDQYGKGLCIFEIETIDEDVYKEKLIWVIDPDYRNGMIGIHHLSNIGEVTVFDYAGWRFVASGLWPMRRHRSGVPGRS